MLRPGSICALTLAFTLACGPAAPQASAKLAVSATPVASIAATAPDGSVLFSRATSATRTSDGTIVAADGGDRLLRFFDSAGRPLRTAGHSGAGPGEFQALLLLPHCLGDSLVVWDGPSNRASVFDAAGVFARTFAQPHLLSKVACAHGTFAALLGVQTASPGEALRSSLLLFNARGDSTGGIADIPLGELRPMGRETGIALTRDALYIGTADSGAVDRYTLTGARSGTLSLGLTSQAPSDAEYERAVDKSLLPFPPSQRAMMKKMLLKVPKPARAPAYGAIVDDAVGDLWVTTSLAGDSVTTFRVVSPAGEVLANVSLAGDVSLMEVGSDYLLGLATGADGEQRVVEYGVRRGADGAGKAGQIR